MPLRHGPHSFCWLVFELSFVCVRIELFKSFHLFEACRRANGLVRSLDRFGSRRPFWCSTFRFGFSLGGERQRRSHKTRPADSLTLWLTRRLAHLPFAMCDMYLVDVVVYSSSASCSSCLLASSRSLSAFNACTILMPYGARWRSPETQTSVSKR